MPTITAPDVPLSTAAGFNAAIVDEMLINLESGHLRCHVSCCFPIALATVCVWTGSMSRGYFHSDYDNSFGGHVQKGDQL